MTVLPDAWASCPTQFQYNGRIDTYLLKLIGAEMEEQAVRWNVKVSKETDLILRTFLGSQGMRKGDLSKFIEDAVRWRVFNKTVQDIKAKNAGSSVDDLQKLIDEALGEVRAERRKSEVADKR